MWNITIEGANTTSQPVDIEELMSKFEQITDTRSARGIRFKLSWILLMILLARLAGETKPNGICDWLYLRAEDFAKLFD